MKRTLWNLSILLVTGAAVEAQSPQTPRRAAPQTQVEEIYVVRSVPESQTAPTEFCAPTKTGIADAIAEVRYSLRSISINASDGRVLDANVNTIGTEHFCGGRTQSPTILKAYADLRIASKMFNGTGERRRKADFPERGINEFYCSLDLTAPDDQYVGGLMTTSAVTSLKNVGLESEPSGYTQTSILTIRIWKKRTQR